ncbi:MAG: hypothetical protein GXY44_12620 [Phycisphaerales bacterium]|nr:hypothetical protein [Phycisphaerales bacterium]
MPVTLDHTDRDSAILAPIASTVERAPLAGPGTGTTGSPMINIDDSTAEAVVQSFIILANAGEEQRLIEILVPEQAETMSGLLMAIQPLQQALEELGQTVQQQIPDAAGQAKWRDQGLGRLLGISGQLQLDPYGVIAQAQDELSAMATLEVVGGTIPQSIQVFTHLLDDRWRIEMPQLNLLQPGLIDQWSMIAPSVAQNIRDLTIRIQQNEFTSMEMVEQELSRIMTQMGTSMIGEPPIQSLTVDDGFRDSESVSPTAPMQSVPPSLPQREGQREDVDNVYSGPGMLRGG